MLTCEQARMQLERAHRSAALRAHLDRCSGCRAWARLEDRLVGLAEERVAAPAGLVDAVLLAHRARPRRQGVVSSLERIAFRVLGDPLLRLEHGLIVAADLAVSRVLVGLRLPVEALALAARRVQHHLVSAITIPGQALHGKLGQSEGTP